MGFLEIRFTDILDIVLVAILLYQVYNLIRGTVAIKIFIGIFFMYLVWLLVKALNMQLLSNILGQVMGVGVIALLIVFQQEIRRFFLVMGSKYFAKFNFSLEGLFAFMVKPAPKVNVNPIVKACENMSRTKTGALIVIAKTSSLEAYADTGEIINADTSYHLIESIFFKNSPLHDGALIVVADKLYAARCVLPVSDAPNIPAHLGLRHRSAKGISEVTDAFVIVVSEETGYISYVKYGVITTNIMSSELRQILENEFIIDEKTKNTKEHFYENNIEV